MIILKKSVIYVTLIASERKNKNATKNITFDIEITVPCVYTYWVYKVYIHHSRNSYNKSQQDALLLNFILVKDSTCFGQSC